ncbi:hypothetical protein Barb4_03977 [Bacteroidales bacterium Barb4]|nr:hypothetical protein Barb4_03977 [Bacteroidales bacterium Barb4]
MYINKVLKERYNILSSFQDTPDGVVPVTPHSAFAACGAEIFCPFQGICVTSVNYKKKICTQKQQRALYVPKYCKLIYNYQN